MLHAGSPLDPRWVTRSLTGPAASRNRRRIHLHIVDECTHLRDSPSGRAIRREVARADLLEGQCRRTRDRLTVWNRGDRLLAGQQVREAEHELAAVPVPAHRESQRLTEPHAAEIDVAEECVARAE